MIPIKTKEEIEKMRQGGKILAEILEKVKAEVKPGVTTGALDKLADDLIAKAGEPSFKKVRDYQWATCMCVNEVIVHGIPGEYRLKSGDLLGIDLGMLYKGFHTDMAETIIINHLPGGGTPPREEGRGRHPEGVREKERFLKTGKEALKRAIEAARVGNHVGHISQAIQDTTERAGYSPVRALVGHGIGKNLHEDPKIPCFLRGKLEETPLLKAGMALAIEIIYNEGKPGVIYSNDDGWTIQTVDGKLSGLFEKTIAVLPNGPEILTQLIWLMNKK